MTFRRTSMPLARSCLPAPAPSSQSLGARPRARTPARASAPAARPPRAGAVLPPLQDNQQRGRELKDLVRRALAAGLPVRLGADDMVCNAADLALQLIARDSLMRVEVAGASASASAPPPYIPGPYIASLIRPSTRATRRCGSW
jgi:hypothetical protein